MRPPQPLRHPAPSAPLDDCLDGRTDPTLGPATLLFVDIAGYTAFAERHPPREVIRTLDDYFRAVTAPVLDEGGRVVDYYGDGFFAAFTPRLGEPAGGHARRGLRAAVRLFDALGPFNEALARRLDERFKIRAGLHSGEVVTGTIGLCEVQKEAIVGDAVNVASRVEAANKLLGTRLLVTEQVLSAAVPDLRETAWPGCAPSEHPSLSWVPLCTAHLHVVELPGKSVRFRLFEVDPDAPSCRRRPTAHVDAEPAASPVA